MVECFSDWMLKRDGLQQASRWARYYLKVYQKYFPPHPLLSDLRKTVRETVAQSNQYFINTTRRLVSLFTSQDYAQLIPTLEAIKDEVSVTHSEYTMTFYNVFDTVENLSKQL
jgi:hypothetical protein